MTKDFMQKYKPKEENICIVPTKKGKALLNYTPVVKYLGNGNLYALTNDILEKEFTRIKNCLTRTMCCCTGTREAKLCNRNIDSLCVSRDRAMMIIVF